MEHHICTLDRGIQDVRLADVAPYFEHANSVVSESRRQIFDASSYKVVKYNYLSDILVQQCVDCVGANKSRSADNNDLFSAQFYLREQRTGGDGSLPSISGSFPLTIGRPDAAVGAAWPP